MLTQIEVRTLSGELNYVAADKQQTIPELSGTILLPKNHDMLVRVCEHRKSVMNGKYKPKPLSEATMRKYRLRPEYAKPSAVAATPRTSEAERIACQRKAQAILDEHEDEQRAINRNCLLLSAL